MTKQRKYKSFTFTLNKSQAEYLNHRCQSGYSKSKWVRDAIDARIKIEVEELKTRVRLGLIKKSTGTYTEDAKTALRDTFSAHAKTVGDIRETLHRELTEYLVNTSGNLLVQTGEQPEVRQDVGSDERAE